MRVLGIIRQGETYGETMRESIRCRTLKCAEYIVDHRATLRQAAKAFGMGKSTVHTDVSVRLPQIDAALYREVHAILVKNHETRHIRGGESTRRKYLARQ